MDKSCHSISDSSSSSASSGATTANNPYLGLNRLSHKISKPGPTAADHHNHPLGNLQQPPVYSINKSDFREVVQKLTGSPARLSSPPPPIIRSPSSRLHRIRPPPLINPSPQVQNPIPNNPIQFPATTSSNPLSPLPPLPSVLAAAESPVSAYMRYLHSSPLAVTHHGRSSSPDSLPRRHRRRHRSLSCLSDA